MQKFIPNTPTVNPDKEYFISGDVFIKRDFDVGRGIKEAFFISLLQEHDYFPKFVGYRVENGFTEIALGKIEAETLENLKGKLTKEDKNEIQSQLLCIFDILQAQNIVHGDINESNLLYNQETKHLYLIDFEFAVKEVSDRDLTGPNWGIIHVLKFLNV